MTNSLKNTVCKICGNDLNSMSFDKMMLHKQMHIREATEDKKQKRIDSFE